MEHISANWPELRTKMAAIDLDVYRANDHIGLFAPKSRLNVRWALLLHPVDLILYTSLVMSLRNAIGTHRIPERANRVFSFRSEGAPIDALFRPDSGYQAFVAQCRKKAGQKKTLFVGVTDIGDFFNRIYQHRLINALEVAAPHERDKVRALEKLLGQFTETSYGIPVGPSASRVLAEAVLIDVDSALLSEGVDFVRFVDDYVIFGRTPEVVEDGLHKLADALFSNHGLTLQTGKTEVLPVDEYETKYLTAHSDKEAARRALVTVLNNAGYEVAYADLDPAAQAQVDAMNLEGMLEEALQPGRNVDFREVSFILGRLSALQRPDLIPTVLRNVERLYPVAHSMAAFFTGFDALPKATRKRAAKSLLRPLLRIRAVPPPYYAVWALSIVAASSEWNSADELLRIYRSTASPIVKRYAALALAKSGRRAHVLALKADVRHVPSLVRTAILLASHQLGSDERRHWRRGLRLSEPLDLLL